MPTRPRLAAGNSHPVLEPLEDRTVPAVTRPLLFVPGQPASVPVSVAEAPDAISQAVAFDAFIGQLGAKPWELTSVFDFSLFGAIQAVSPTNALVADFVNLGGYTLYEDDATVNPTLFVAAQDWRMPVAPLDGVDDGNLSNLTAQSIADDVFATDLAGNDGVYRYGVDYLGYWMMKAMDAWVAAGGDPSVGVDVVSHSEGYVITRAYVSSSAYGGSYTGAQSGTLPTIANWVSLAGVNEGASGIYNLLTNNFSNPLGSDPAGGLYLFEEAAYLKVTDPLLPEPILGPDGSPYITPAAVASGDVTTGEFIQMYIGSLRDEMATYPFLDGEDVNDDPNFRNSLILDVNAGTDPNAFVERMTVGFTAAAGTQLSTLTTATSRTGTGGTILAVGDGFTELVEVVEILATGELPPTQASDNWILDNAEPVSGDGSVAARSSLGDFTGDARITVLPQDRPAIDHNGAVSDPFMHLLVLNVVQPGLFPPKPPTLVGLSDGSVQLVNHDTGTPITATFRPLDVDGVAHNSLVSMATGDLNGDGVPDLFVAAAAAGSPGDTKAGKVFVYDGAALANGGLTLIRSFTPFATTSGPGGNTGAYLNGLNIAVGDVNGDGTPDLVAGSRSNSTADGTVEFGRFVVIDGTSAAGTNNVIGSVVTPFGPGYQKGVVVAAGDLDGDGSAEIAVTRGGPVAASNPNKTVKLKAFRLNGTALVELDLSGTGAPLAPFAGVGTGDSVIQRDARIAFTDVNGDNKADLVFSALDRTTDPTNVQVRIAAFSVSTATGAATEIGTGTGPSNSYLVGKNVVDHAISGFDPDANGSTELAVVTQSAASGVQYLAPLTGAVIPGGFVLDVLGGGVTLAGV